jgi:hypothetical protein
MAPDNVTIADVVGRMARDTLFTDIVLLPVNETNTGSVRRRSPGPLPAAEA